MSYSMDVEFGASILNRRLEKYPSPATRRNYLGLVVIITGILYYALYVGGGVAPLLMNDLHISFETFLTVLAVGNMLGAFASLIAGLADRFGRANLVIYGLMIVGGLTAFVVPATDNALEWGIAYGAVSFVEGIILVATPALIRDFSPQTGRATAMGFWTVGPVLGSMVTGLVASLTLPLFSSWQSQYLICGAVCVVMSIVAFLFLRELSPDLRDQVIVNDGDRQLIELRARTHSVAVDLSSPWRQMMRLNILVPSFGGAVLTIFLFSASSFGTVYLTTLFGLTVREANLLSNLAWGADIFGLIAAGILSDKLRVRKPFMIFGGIGAASMIYVFMSMAGQQSSFYSLVIINTLIFVFTGIAYTTWMAAITETMEARNPALTATGLAIWAWMYKVVISCCFFALPLIVTSATPLIEAPQYQQAYNDAVAAGSVPSAELVAHVERARIALLESPHQWRQWYWVCIGGILLFLLATLIIPGRWRPSAARADELAHNAATEAELRRLRAS